MPTTIYNLFKIHLTYGSVSYSFLNMRYILNFGTCSISCLHISHKLLSNILFTKSMLTFCSSKKTVNQCLWNPFYICWPMLCRGSSTVLSISVCQGGHPVSRPARSACYRKVRFYHCVIESFPPVPTTGSKKAVHVLLCLCNNACKRSLAICRNSRASCPVSRLLSVPSWPACAKQGR